MVMRIKSGGAFRDIAIPRVKSGGAFRDVSVVRVKSGGAWRDITFGMRWTIVGGTEIHDQIRFSGFADGYPQYGYTQMRFGTIDPNDDRGRKVLGDATLAAVSTLYQPNVWQHYRVYFFEDWGTMTAIQNELNANYNLSIEGTNGFKYVTPFSAGVWKAGGSAQLGANTATMWERQPATEDFEHLYLASSYLIEILRK